MDGVALGTSNLIAGMAAHHTTGLRLLIEMTSKAGPVGGGGLQFVRLDDVVGGGRLGVNAAHAVT